MNLKVNTDIIFTAEVIKFNSVRVFLMFFPREARLRFYYMAKNRQLSGLLFQLLHLVRWKLGLTNNWRLHSLDFKNTHLNLYLINSLSFNLYH